MKNVTTIALRFLGLCMALLVGTFAFAQNNDSKTKTDKKTTTSESKKVEVKSDDPKPGTLKNHGKEIQQIIKSEEGVIRGYNFGTTKQKIKETETAKYVSDGRDFIIYHVSID